MFDTKIKISIFLKFVEYVSVGFFVKVIATIENLKAQTFVFQEGIRSLKTIERIATASPCLNGFGYIILS